jgi:DNA mismatch endonuclease, patch repair protein
MDIVDKDTRSRMMAAVRSKDTEPEMLLRRALFRHGYRYRLHRSDLPGKPDIVFPKYRAVIFVNGCFWHYHGCRNTNIPATRRAWWLRKLEANRKRDAAAKIGLRDAGWRTAVVWECAFRQSGMRADAAPVRLARRIGTFLESGRRSMEIPSSGSQQIGELPL